MIKRLMTYGAFIFLFLASFIFGARFGVQQNMKMQSAVEATLLVGELETLRKKEKIDLLIQSKEIALDGKIALYKEFKENEFSWIFYPDNNALDNERYLKNIARYRQSFSSVVPTIPIPENTPMTEDMKRNALAVQEATRYIIEKYGAEK